MRFFSEPGVLHRLVFLKGGYGDVHYRDTTQEMGTFTTSHWYIPL